MAHTVLSGQQHDIWRRSAIAARRRCQRARSRWSPRRRGAVLISIWFDPADDGNLRRRVAYERAPS